MRKTLCLVLLIYSVGAQAYPPQNTCVSRLNDPTTITTDFLKNYLMANLCFPQMGLGIAAAEIGFFLSREISAEQYLSNLSPQDFERILSAMNAAHSAHGVNIADPRKKLESFAGGTLIFFRTNTLYTVLLRLAKGLAAPSTDLNYFNVDENDLMLLSAAELADKLYSEPRYREIAERAKGYGKTLLSALKSREAIELSKRHREDIKQNGRSDLLKLTAKTSAELKVILINALNAAHPELTVPAPGSTQTKAEVFIEAIN
jgi:hypothetical protein